MMILSLEWESGTLFAGFMRILIILLLTFITSANLCYARNNKHCANIPTDRGPVTGVDLGENDMCEYRGIPYAAPPVGSLRFEKPVPHAEWQQPYLAYEFGPECLQYPMSIFPSRKLVGSEDCLYLNIWQPNDAGAELLPVMLFVHGGGFVSGSGSQEIYRGNRLSEQGRVVVVTFNYRLGAMGFLAHPALRDSKGTSGNYGMYDMAYAVSWVRKNIEYFGGDPHNITLFGESAGAVSIANFIASPSVSAMFRRAIMQSSPMMMIYRTLDEAEKEGSRAAEMLGCGDPATAAMCLRQLPADKIYGIVRSGMTPPSSPNGKNNSSEAFSFQPNIDGKLIPGRALEIINKGGFSSDIGIMLGVNRDETTIFNIGRDLRTYDEFRSSLGPNVEYIRERYGAEVEPSDMLRQYAPGRYKTPKRAYIEMTTDTRFVCPTRAAARLFAENNIKTYLYMFTKAPVETGFAQGLGAFHGCELPFVFGNFRFMGLDFKTRSNRALSRRVIDLWTTFARTGIPRAFEVPDWRPYSAEKDNFLLIGDVIETSEGMNREKCDYLEGLLVGSFGG